MTSMRLNHWARIMFFATLVASTSIGSSGRVAFASEPVTEANVATKIAAAQSAADHEALAAYFRAQSAAAKEKVGMHEQMLASAAKNSGKGWASWEQHCNSLIRTYKEEQKAAEELATAHETMAKAAK